MNPQILSDEIDSLLARYLQLLDEYTSLRVPLGSLQSSIYTNIARANFQAERGVSYGAESYDRRAMRAGRLCRVTGEAEDGTVALEVEKVASTRKAGLDTPRGKAEASQTQDIEEGMEKITANTECTSDAEDNKGDTERKDSTDIPDPLRIFGFRIPSALCTAQSSSIQLVETSIPRLATITLQMRAVEIQIRRAKKYRAKALALMGEEGDLKVEAKKGAVG